MKSINFWKREHLWVLVVCLAVTTAATAVYFYSLKQDSYEEIKSTSAIYTERTESVINAVFHRTDVLAAVIKLENGNLSKSTFNNIAKTVYKKNSGIRGIQSMPKAVVTYSYPVKGNEAVMGKDFFKIPERRKDVLLAINTKSIALSGPYHLIQGGLGVVARNPIFLKDKNGKEYFWGFSTIVLDLPDAISSVGLSNLQKAGYDYQLYSVNENNDRIVIAGNKKLDTGKATITKISVPHHHWNLAIVDLHPMKDVNKAIVLFVLGLLLSILIWRMYCTVLLERAAVQTSDRFFSDISHDMRTPLNAIIGFSMLAQMPGATEKEKDNYIGKIESSGKLLLDLVDDTLTMSKMSNDKLQLSYVPIATGIVSASILEPIQIIAKQKNIEVNLDASELDSGMVMIDKLNVEKIFLNVLNNAVKYTPEGGHIWIKVSNTESPDPVLNAVITDDGIGMSDDFLPHIFEPFAQERRVGYESLGTGLGLPIVKRLVDMMDGTIDVESTLGKGSTFKVTIPWRSAENTSEESTNINDQELDITRLKGKRVLLVEDNELNMEIASSLLTNMGLSVDTAENGKIGVDMFKNSKLQWYDAILMDLRMPIMNGYEATTAIRSMDREDSSSIPIIAMTADAFSEDIKKCEHYGMDAHVSKPIDQKKLADTLLRLIR